MVSAGRQWRCHCGHSCATASMSGAFAMATRKMCVRDLKQSARYIAAARIRIDGRGMASSTTCPIVRLRTVRTSQELRKRFGLRPVRDGRRWYWIQPYPMCLASSESVITQIGLELARMESKERHERWPVIGQSDVTNVCREICESIVELERAFEAGELPSRLTRAASRRSSDRGSTKLMGSSRKTSPELYTNCESMR